MARLQLLSAARREKLTIINFSVQLCQHVNCSAVLVSHWLRYGHRPPGRPEGRPRQAGDDRQVFAVQVLRRDRQPAGLWV